MLRDSGNLPRTHPDGVDVRRDTVGMRTISVPPQTRNLVQQSAKALATGRAWSMAERPCHVRERDRREHPHRARMSGRMEPHRLPPTPRLYRLPHAAPPTPTPAFRPYKHGSQGQGRIASDLGGGFAAVRGRCPAACRGRSSPVCAPRFHRRGAGRAYRRVRCPVPRRQR